MEKGIELTALSKMKAEIQQLKEEVQGNASKEDIYLFRLEDYCNSLRGAIINSTLNLPSMSSFRFYFFKLKELSNIEYILGLLHECWVLLHPTMMFNSIYKDSDPIKILENSLCKYSDNKSACYDNSYDIVSEELNSSTNIIIASAYFRKIQESKDLSLFCEYLDELYKMVKSSCKNNEISIEQGFIPVSCLKVRLNRNQLQLIFERIAAEGFMANDDATKHSFLSLFSNTLHTTAKKIIWLDVNKKNNQPSVASLYTMFSALGVDMNIHSKEIICRLFNDANNNPISPESLKPRKDSDTLLQIRSIVREICGS